MRKELVLLTLSGCLFSSCGNISKPLKSQITDLSSINEDGSMIINFDYDAFDEKFDLFDIAKIKINEKEYTCPVTPNLKFGDKYDYALVMDETKKTISIGIVGDYFADYEEYAIRTYSGGFYYFLRKENVSYPLEVEASLLTKGGFASKALAYDLSYSSQRKDYSSDEIFANFRVVDGLKENKIYRSSSPINGMYDRNYFSDGLAYGAGVTNFIELIGKKEDYSRVNSFKNSYFASKDYIFSNIKDIDEDFETAMVAAVDYINDNPEGKFLIACENGVEKTGFMVAILQGISGIDFETIKNEYLLSYINIYKVIKDSEQYSALSDKFINDLSKLFDKEIKTESFENLSKEYLESIGVSQEDIESLVDIIKA